MPQRRALFRHLNFQTCSDTEVVCTFYTFVLSKMISHNMTLEIDLLWALRAAIPQGKLERGERERLYIYIVYLFINIYFFIYLLIYLFVNNIYIYIICTAYNINSNTTDIYIYIIIVI